MKASFLEVYALVVCLISLIWFAMVIGFGLYDVVKLIDPAFTIDNYQYKRHLSNNNFWQPKSKDIKRRPSEPELTAQREQSWQHALAMERRGAKQGLTNKAIAIVISGLLLYIHSRLYQHERRRLNAGTIS